MIQFMIKVLTRIQQAVCLALPKDPPQDGAAQPAGQQLVRLQHEAMAKRILDINKCVILCSWEASLRPVWQEAGL
jgi:hypothetical protein